MNTLEVLDELQRKAMADQEIRSALLKTRQEQDPLRAFCKKARELGYELYEMELVDAGEHLYAQMKRSTNGGGENSPVLEELSKSILRTRTGRIVRRGCGKFKSEELL